MIEIKNIPISLKKEGLEEKLIKVCEENDIVFMAIFGSFMRGDYRKESDIDIAIEYDNKSNKSLLDLIHLENELTELSGKKVDLGIFSSISPYIIEDVKKGMQVIYEKR